MTFSFIKHLAHLISLHLVLLVLIIKILLLLLVLLVLIIKILLLLAFKVETFLVHTNINAVNIDPKITDKFRQAVWLMVLDHLILFLYTVTSQTLVRNIFLVKMPLDIRLCFALFRLCPI